jgi:uncharacterized RDD family membrane protein YckC
MLVLQWAVLSQFRDLLSMTEEWFKESINLQLYVTLSISLPVWLYFAYFDSKMSNGTFGKRLFRLSVNSISGQKISFGKSLSRSILKLLPWELAHIGVIFPEPLYFSAQTGVRWLTYVGMLLFLIYVLSIVVTEKRQTLYDKYLNTLVLN